VGRPKEHDERTAAALLVAAERMVQESGPEAVSVRGVATEVGTTTRAVYSVFGSKDGLVAALATRGFELLGEGLEAIPATDDPRADLVAAGLMFRRFATEHPSLFALAIQRNLPVSPWPEVRRAASLSLRLLKRRIQRVADAGALDGRTVDDVTLEFHGLCEGLATLELRGMAPRADWGRVWADGLTALVGGYDARASHSS
jgi:AcrR family transcriptional regulator